ncbi:Mth938-like domain-containing protein [Terasakiella sp. SH-1]|uniref:Mth938-like domain-containing protein n=1 Tax=Terasakiella sp. SH-1 TaxID=2560057 RepID=UPI0010749488|nr:Mth938-like domain-containing protein [Terasakiella sp. SH-1]
MSLDITPVITDNRLMIKSYGEGTFTVNDHKVTGAVLLYDGKVEPWQISDVSEITLDSLAPLFNTEEDYDILLIGIGALSQMPPKTLKEAVKEKGLILEWMNSGAAARTFNVLQTEDRRVIAALIAVD